VVTYEEVRKAIDELSEKDRDVLGWIAIGQGDGHPKAAVKRLKGLGLVETQGRPMPGWPEAIETRLATPILVHMVWCAWCSDNTPDEASE
jgi:hypothetical protein